MVNEPPDPPDMTPSPSLRLTAYRPSAPGSTNSVQSCSVRSLSLARGPPGFEVSAMISPSSICGFLRNPSRPRAGVLVQPHRLTQLRPQADGGPGGQALQVRRRRHRGDPGAAL